MEQWGRLLSDSGLETADISAGLAHVFAVGSHGPTWRHMPVLTAPS